METDKTLEKILNQIENIDNKISSMDNKINTMDNKISNMDNKINTMGNKISNMDNRIVVVEGQLKENTQILKALEHASEVHKAKFDKLNIQIAEIKGEITSFKKETSEKFNEVNNNIKEIHSDVSLANVTASKNRIDIEMIKNVINK
jgi:chromosome segregation ATPase